MTPFADLTFDVARKNKASAPAVRPLRILYAEDLRDLREIARVSLARDGHRVECVINGALALSHVVANPAGTDLLLTDHHMPVMNGLALVAAVRALAFPGKIIVFSSELSPAVTAEYHKLKVDCVLPKPIFPSELRAVIAGLFPAEPAPSPRPPSGSKPPFSATVPVGS